MTVPTHVLHDGVSIPLLGFGTFKLPNTKETSNLIETAIEAGYPSIDTAAGYGNEEAVGDAIRGADRASLFITTKLKNSDHGYDNTLRAFDASMKRLGLDVLDLYLIHWPGDPDDPSFVETWRAFLRLRAEGCVRTVGVSNFFEEHLKKLIDETGEVPSVNQIECHPYLHQPEAIPFCLENRILIEAWSPLMRGETALSDPVVAGIAKAHGKTPAQVVLRWHLQNGRRAIPKTATPARIKENIDIFDFELSDAERAAIDALREKNVRTGPHPHTFFE